MYFISVGIQKLFNISCNDTVTSGEPRGTPGTVKGADGPLPQHTEYTCMIMNTLVCVRTCMITNKSESFITPKPTNELEWRGKKRRTCTVLTTFRRTCLINIKLTCTDI